MAAPFRCRLADLKMFRELLEQHGADAALDVAELMSFHGGPDFSLLLPEASPPGVWLGQPLRWFDYC